MCLSWVPASRSLSRRLSSPAAHGDSNQEMHTKTHKTQLYQHEQTLITERGSMSRPTSYLRLSGSNPLDLKLCQGGFGAWGKNLSPGTSLAVPRLRLRASNARGVGSIPGWKPRSHVPQGAAEKTKNTCPEQAERVRTQHHCCRHSAPGPR